MKNLAIATVAAVMAAGTALANPIVGTVWKTNVDDGKYAHIEMRSCGADICGVFLKTFKGGESYASANLGKKLVEGMTPKGKGNYQGGTIWEPSSDKKYRSSMEILGGGKMRVKGCVLVICKKFVWTQIK